MKKEKRTFKKLSVAYLPFKNVSCIPHPHYDLFEEDPKRPGSGWSVACILPADKESINLIKKWVKQHNKGNAVRG